MSIVDAGVPVLVFFAMVVVGMELTTDDFRRVARQPGTVVAATVGQFVLLPIIGWLLVRCLGLQPAIAQGVLLVAACPSGAMANVYTYLARANVALSVTLTAVSCLAAVLTTPLALAALQAQVGESTGFPVPFAVLAGQLVLLLVLPVLAGMGIRRRWPDITQRHGRTLLGFSIATLAALLGLIIVQEAEQFARALTDIAAAAALLTVLAFGAGWATGWASARRSDGSLHGGDGLRRAECRDRDGHRRHGPGPGRVRRVCDRLFPGTGADPSRGCSCVPMHDGSLTEATPQELTTHEPLRCTYPRIRRTGQDTPGMDSEAVLRCPLPVRPRGPDALTSDLCNVLEEAGCPAGLSGARAPAVRDPAGGTVGHLRQPSRQSGRFADRVGLAATRGVPRDRPGRPGRIAGRPETTGDHALLPPAGSAARFLGSSWTSSCPGTPGPFTREKSFGCPRCPTICPPKRRLEREYCLQVGLKSHVMIPLKVMGSVVGAIGFASFRWYRDWPDDLIQRLRLVGDIFTNALARKRADEALRAREQSLRQTREGLRKLAAKLLHAQEEERRRIAREMHDDWTQRLALLGIDIAKLEKHIGAPENALPLLRTMQEQLVSLSEDVHALSRQLHPSILDDLGLVEALRSECASFSRREGIAVVYRPEEVPTTLPKDVALCVYRVAQEALRNLAKHAAVNEAWVTLAADRPGTGAARPGQGRRLRSGRRCALSRGSDCPAWKSGSVSFRPNSPSRPPRGKARRSRCAFPWRRSDP